MLITIDEYYSIDFYNRCLTSLRNNGVKYTEYISTTGNNSWYLDIDRKPCMVDYDICPKSEERYLVSKVISLDSDSEYRYYRRLDSQHHFNDRYIINDYFSEIKNTNAYLLKVDKKDLYELSMIDKSSKVWYLGRYLSGRYKLAITNSEALRSIIPREKILLEKTQKMHIETFETEINYRVLMGKERLVKFSATPYFLSGKYIIPPYYDENEKMRFLVQ